MSVIDEIIGLYDEEFGHEGESVVSAARAELAALRAAAGEKKSSQQIMDERWETAFGVQSLQSENEKLRQRVAELEKQVKFQEGAWHMLNRVCNQFKHFNRVVTNLYRGLPAFQTTEDSHRFITRIGEEIRKHEVREYGPQPADSKSEATNEQQATLDEMTRIAQENGEYDEE